MRPQAGQVINNKYRLIRLIGDGGMGTVYEARHEVLGTTVALKFLHPELSRRSGLVQRFLQEARVSAQIQSPHVVRVTDVDQTTGGLAFIVMEYLEGRTLQTLYEDLYRAGVRLSHADALEYAMQMLEGVDAAHRAGIVHRDLKPDNVIITKTPKGEPLLKLLDFGIAKLKVTGQLDRGLTRPGVIMGTPEYMAPEQAYSADAVDARADIFSLGVMIFEMLAGRRPVGGDEPHQIAAAYLAGQISKLSDLAPGLAPELCAAVHRAMAPQPADRFPSVAELRDAISPFAQAARGPAAATPAPSEVSQVRSAAASPAPGADSGGAAAAVTPASVATPAAAVTSGGVANPALIGTTDDPADGAPAASPATNIPGDGGYGAIPKTIPPDEEPHHASGAPPVGAATPLGGFAADGRGGADLSADPQIVAAGVSPAPDGAPLPATVSAAPYMPPTGGPSPGVDAPALDMSPRPGGTAIGNAPAFQKGSTAAYDEPAPMYGGQGMPGTAPMDPLPATSPAGAAAARKPSRSGPPLLVILLLAAGITGAVVGGVYIAHEFGRTEERADTLPIEPPPAPVSVAVPSDPPPPEATAPEPPPTTTSATPKPKPTSPKPPATTPTSPKPPPTTPTSPPTTPTSPPTTPTTPPTTPTAPPSSSGTPILPFPPVVLPSSFPFPLPLPPASPKPPGSNPNPNPPGSGTIRPKIPIPIIH